MTASSIQNTQQKLEYLTGFANEFATEAVSGALPIGRNSPQKAPYGLYAEQISGTAFTAPRAHNRRSWCYRIRPSAVLKEDFQAIALPHWLSIFGDIPAPPTQMRWSPTPVDTNTNNRDFIDGLFTFGGNGSPAAQTGCGIHIYTANRSMNQRFFYNSDGEMLIILQQGRLRFETEMGVIEAEPQEIVVIPRGIRFRVQLLDATARGYVCENYGALFRLPDLGVIGSNGLANPRDFLTPVAAYEDREGDFELITKFNGCFWRAGLGHHPLDVVAWHGNLAPYKYDLRRFNTIGSISYDHPDPSIFLVLQSPSAVAGVDSIDFVIFPPRWLCATDTFRPPWFHRNIASEFMGLVHGEYDAKADGFLPGGASLHNCMIGHGPDASTFEKASAINTSQPQWVGDTMAFMIETPAIIHPTQQALDNSQRQQNYTDCWRGIKKYFVKT